MTFPGPSRTIVVEPVERPEPLRSPVVAPGREPAKPEREPVPAAPEREPDSAPA